MTRVKIGLCLITSAALLALTSPAAAAPGGATGGAAPAATTVQTALVPAHGKPVTKAVRGAVTLANQDGACNSMSNGDGDFCLWFGANFVGSMSDFFFSDTNLNNNFYLTPGLGLGEVVANNSESALNADSNLGVFVFTGTGFSGAGGFIQPRQFGNFNTTFVNNVESHEFF